MKKIIFILSFIATGVCAQTAQYALGTYWGQWTKYANSQFVSSCNGILVLYKNLNDSLNCVWEMDSCLNGGGSWNGQPWNILVKTDSSLARCNNCWQGGTIDNLVSGKLYSNDSIYIYYRTFPANNLVDNEFGGFKISGVSNLEQIPLDWLVSVYPNPSSQTLFLEYSEGVSESKPLLYDITGKFVEVSTELVNYTTMRIKVADLPEGLYYLRYSTNRGYANKKILVQR